MAVQKLARGDLTRYWAEMSDDHLSEADGGLAVVCYAGMPEWFNRFYAVYQRKAFDRLLAGEDFSGAKVLDIGTGVGRWARWFAAWPGSQVVGIDGEAKRLQSARELSGENIEYINTTIDTLAFPDGSFDVANSVGVLQHVDDDVKRRTIAEVARVLKSGGQFVVFELTDVHDDAPHVFAWRDEAWRSEFERNGLRVQRVIGDQFAPVLRLMKTAHSIVKHGRSRREIEQMKNGDVAASRGLLKPLRAGVALSYPIEEVARFLPPSLARVKGYLLRKD